MIHVLTNEQVRNLGEGGNTCLDSPARKADLHKPAGLYPCHRQGGNQVQIEPWMPNPIPDMCFLSPVDHSFHCQLVFAPRFHDLKRKLDFRPLPPFLLFYFCTRITFVSRNFSRLDTLVFDFPCYSKQKFWSNFVCKINRSIFEIYFKNRIKICEKFKYINMIRNSTKENLNIKRYFRILSSSKVDFSFLQRKHF